MERSMSLLIRKYVFFTFQSLAVLMACWLLPVAAANADDGKAKLKITWIAASSTVHVVAQHVPLGQLLVRLGEITHIALHNDGLAAGQAISGDCVGGMLHEIMTCLVGGEVNTLVRLADSGQVSEAWILGQGGALSTNQNKLDIADLLDESEEETDPVLERLQSKDPAQRLQGLDELRGHSVIDPVLEKRVVHEALNDENPAIRAKAVANVSRLEKDSTSQLLMMLADQDSGVRQATLVTSYDNPQVLQEGLYDSDENVRNYAEMLLVRYNQSQSPP
jgi:hypothetical protein